LTQPANPPERDGAEAQPEPQQPAQPQPAVEERPVETVEKPDPPPEPGLGDLITRGSASRAEEAYGERDAARRFLMDVAGDVNNHGIWAGRDVIMAAGGEIAQSAVPAERLRRVRDVFASPDCYDRALELLRRHRVVVLSGSQDQGKLTAALHLLLDCEPGAEREVRQLDPQTEPARLLALDPKRDIRYVVAGVGVEQARALTQLVLDGLGQALARSGGYLVLTVDATALLETQELGERLVPYAAPNPAAVLDRHLGDASGHPRIAEALRDERVQALLAERPTPRQVEGLARRLTDAIGDGMPLDAALSQVDVQVRKDVARWFAGDQAVDRTLLDRSFIIAMAVLGGASYQSVLDAARKLYERLASDEAMRSEERFFAKTRTQLLGDVGAHPAIVQARTPIGLTPLEVVEFDCLAWQRTVLWYVWEQYDWVSVELVPWIRALCTDADPATSVRAAVALGELCLHDFGQIWRQILEPWSLAQSTRMRRSAAAALAIPAWDDALASRVRSALLHWAREDAEWRERWTAAAAFGVYHIGLRFPDDAFEVLEELLQAEELSVVAAAAESLAGLFDLGLDVREPRDYFVRVLEILDRRSAREEHERTVRLAARLTFLKIACESESEAATARGRRWPTLLRLHATGDVAWPRAADLLRRCLDTRSTKDETLDVVQRWLRAAAADPELYDALEGLVMDVAQSEKERVVLRVRLYKWAREDDVAGVARRLRARLEPRTLARTVRMSR
jgi:hypothetical protein